MKLSQRERDIVFCAQLCADAPAQELRKATGYREHTIRYCLRRAQEKGVIRRRCFINLNLLGFTQYQIYLALAAEKSAARTKLVESLVAAEQVSWVGKVGGDFHYGANICARSVGEVAEFLDTVSTRCKTTFFEKVIALRISLVFFGDKYLSRLKPLRTSLAYGTTTSVVAIDEVDHKILAVLTSGENCSVRHLAQIAGIPQRTADYRVKKLQQMGVIVGHYYEVMSDLLGYQSFMLLVSVKGMSAALRQRFVSFCETHPNIVLLIYSLGSWDFEIGASVASADAITGIVEDLYDSFGDALNWIKILPSFGYPKVREYPFKKLA
jgi:DNA-binding Lrp family transcriptional regulator